jgi:hypothetical protein
MGRVNNEVITQRPNGIAKTAFGINRRRFSERLICTFSRYSIFYQFLNVVFCVIVDIVA